MFRCYRDNENLKKHFGHMDKLDIRSDKINLKHNLCKKKMVWHDAYSVFVCLYNSDNCFYINSSAFLTSKSKTVITESKSKTFLTLKRFFIVGGHSNPTGVDYTSRNQCCYVHVDAPWSCIFFLQCAKI